MMVPLLLLLLAYLTDHGDRQAAASSKVMPVCVKIEIRRVVGNEDGAVRMY